MGNNPATQTCWKSSYETCAPCRSRFWVMWSRDPLSACFLDFDHRINRGVINRRWMKKIARKKKRWESEYVKRWNQKISACGHCWWSFFSRSIWFKTPWKQNIFTSRGHSQRCVELSRYFLLHSTVGQIQGYVGRSTATCGLSWVSIGHYTIS